jgi:hypothetical protein
VDPSRKNNIVIRVGDEIVYVYNPSEATDGSYFAFLDEFLFDKTSMENFLRIPHGIFNAAGLTGASGSYMATSVHLEAGQILNFDWAMSDLGGRSRGRHSTI